MKTIYPFMGLALCGVAAQAQEKPNFLIIQCDHLTQRVVGAYGQTQGCTLPIDEVASRGVIFSNAYVGCPLSQPSRAALWSGMMPHQTNVRSNSSEPINPRIPENVPTLGSPCRVFFRSVRLRNRFQKKDFLMSVHFREYVG